MTEHPYARGGIIPGAGITVQYVEEMSPGSSVSAEDFRKIFADECVIVIRDGKPVCGRSDDIHARAGHGIRPEEAA